MPVHKEFDYLHVIFFRELITDKILQHPLVTDEDK